MVYLKLRPYRQTTVAQRLNQKLAPRYYGPYEIVERIGPVAYKLKLPPASSIHPVFHVSQIKKMVGDQQVTLDLPTDGASENIVEPEEVMGKRKISGQQEVLIAWKGLPTSEATWESFEQIQQQFPEFPLEDKVNFQGGSNDMIAGRFGKVYERRSKKRNT